jgi:hypothetical protein
LSKYYLPLSLEKKKVIGALVAHACNRSYSEGHGLKPAPTNSYKTPYLEKKRTGGVAQGIGPEFKLQYKKI